MRIARAWPGLLAFAACASKGPPAPQAQDAPAPVAVAAKPIAAEGSTPAEPSPAPCSKLEVSTPAAPEDPIDGEVPELEASDALAAFYERLAQLQRGKVERPVRIAFFGDSNLTLDGISGVLRRSLQERFGDAGHGAIAIGNPFRGYRHMDVRRTMIGHWITYIFTRGDKPKEGGFGAFGMVARTGERRARVRLETAEESAPVGRRASRLGVYYLKTPKGGRFAIDVDGERKQEVNTAGELSLGEAWLDVEDSGHRFHIENLEQRQFIQLYGAVLERATPGVVVDSLGVTGSTYGTLAQTADPLVEKMLASRSYDLVIFMLGTNFWNSKENPTGLAKLVQLHRPRPIVVITPPDHVKTTRSTSSDPRLVRVEEELAAAAREHRAAVWNFRAAMGGDGSMFKFYRLGLAGKDLYHLSDKGAQVMGHRLSYALLRGYAAYARKEPAAGCAAASP